MPLRRVKLLLAPIAWRLYCPAWRVNTTEQTPGPVRDPLIFACLHRDILPAVRYCLPARPTLLVSKSSDGQILQRTLACAGFGFARGSTGHDGREGFAALLRTLRRGHHVGLAVDGPRGPFGHVHDGALQLARRSGAAIQPLLLDPRRCLQMRTWDRTRVPLPGARVKVVPGHSLTVPRDADEAQLRALRVELARRLGVIGKDGHAGP